jgi:hypothetical protein
MMRHKPSSAGPHGVKKKSRRIPIALVQEPVGKPREGNLKINVDAAFNHGTGEAAVGIIARNHMGQVAMAASLLIGKCTDVEESEACAMRSERN